jgi:hypothetical protein
MQKEKRESARGQLRGNENPFAEANPFQEINFSADAFTAGHRVDPRAPYFRWNVEKIATVDL